MEVPLSSRYVRGGAVVGFAVEGRIVAGLMLLDQIVALGGRPRAGGLKHIRAITIYIGFCDQSPSQKSGR